MKIKHILKSSDFLRVIKRGKKVRGELLTAHILSAGSVEDLMIGVTVSKKAANKAVRRNYIKRIIYSFFREKCRALKRDTLVVVRLTVNINGMKKKQIAEAINNDLRAFTEYLSI